MDIHSAMMSSMVSIHGDDPAHQLPNTPTDDDRTPSLSLSAPAQHKMSLDSHRLLLSNVPPRTGAFPYSFPHSESDLPPSLPLSQSPSHGPDAAPPSPPGASLRSRPNPPRSPIDPSLPRTRMAKVASHPIPRRSPHIPHQRHTIHTSPKLTARHHLSPLPHPLARMPRPTPTPSPPHPHPHPIPPALPHVRPRPRNDLCRLLAHQPTLLLRAHIPVLPLRRPPPPLTPFHALRHPPHQCPPPRLLPLLLLYRSSLRPGLRP
ncbi:hypothetical protein OF83DRAFT_831007 [Amylostereum chailletii]|nr:hypothetical protein OF83DRAFT_831007 [Amylostereum chailletii]